MHLVGEGKYNLNAIKEVKVTESYLGLDMDIKECQNYEAPEECRTQHYIDSLLEKCGCLPLNMAITNVKYLDHKSPSPLLSLLTLLSLIHRNLYAALSS